MIRWAVSGTGTMADNFLKDSQAYEGAQFIAVYSNTAARAQAFAEQHGLSAHYDDFHAMLADTSIDAVYIAGTHRHHAAQAIACLNAGKHVLIEKPMSLTLAEAEAVFAAARTNQRYCAEAMWTKFNPAFQRVIEQIQSGRIGHLRHIQASFGFAFDLSNTAHRLLNPEHAGGGLLDIGIYPIMLPLTLLGLPKSTLAHITLGSSGVDIAGDLILSYDDSVTASLSYRFDANQSTKATLSGDKGWVEMDSAWFNSRQLTWVVQGGEPVVERFDFNGVGWGLEFAAVNDDIVAGRLSSAQHTPEQSLQLAEYLERIRREHGPVYPFESERQ